MKLLISALTIALTLALTSPSVASAAGAGLTEQMNALFPPKKAQPGRNITPATPDLASPKYFAAVSGDKAELTWKAVEGADEYHVQVAKDPNFKWLVANEYHNKTTSFEATGLEAGKHYYWRVAAVKTSNWDTFRKSFFAASMFETK